LLAAGDPGGCRSSIACPSPADMTSFSLTHPDSPALSRFPTSPSALSCAGGPFSCLCISFPLVSIFRTLHSADPHCPYHIILFLLHLHLSVSHLASQVPNPRPFKPLMPIYSLHVTTTHRYLFSVKLHPRTPHPRPAFHIVPVILSSVSAIIPSNFNLSYISTTRSISTYVTCPYSWDL